MTYREFSDQDLKKIKGAFLSIVARQEDGYEMIQAAPGAKRHPLILFGKTLEAAVTGDLDNAQTLDALMDYLEGVAKEQSVAYVKRTGANTVSRDLKTVDPDTTEETAAETLCYRVRDSLLAQIRQEIPLFLDPQHKKPLILLHHPTNLPPEAAILNNAGIRSLKETLQKAALGFSNPAESSASAILKNLTPQQKAVSPVIAATIEKVLIKINDKNSIRRTEFKMTVENAALDAATDFLKKIDAAKKVKLLETLCKDLPPEERTAIENLSQEVKAFKEHYLVYAIAYSCAETTCMGLFDHAGKAERSEGRGKK